MLCNFCFVFVLFVEVVRIILISLLSIQDSPENSKEEIMDDNQNGEKYGYLANNIPAKRSTDWLLVFPRGKVQIYRQKG